LVDDPAIAGTRIETDREFHALIGNETLKQPTKLEAAEF
jgi:hypothetical protein